MYNWTFPSVVYNAAKQSLVDYTIRNEQPGIVSLRNNTSKMSLFSPSTSSFTASAGTTGLLNWFGEAVVITPLVSGPLAELLTGSKNEVALSGEYNLTEYPQLVNSLLIYTDIIDEQYYGGQKLQVLHTHRLDEDKGHVMLESPHYLNVNKSCISSINIRIHDREGNPVKFTDKFLCLSLCHRM
jgi:hypothetical protein